jgi:hypothetical protein
VTLIARNSNKTEVFNPFSFNKISNENKSHPNLFLAVVYIAYYLIGQA